MHRAVRGEVVNCDALYFSAAYSATLGIPSPPSLPVWKCIELPFSVTDFAATSFGRQKSMPYVSASSTGCSRSISSTYWLTLVVMNVSEKELVATE